jgi:hypothetical protein
MYFTGECMWWNAHIKHISISNGRYRDNKEGLQEKPKVARSSEDAIRCQKILWLLNIAALGVDQTETM